MDLLKSLLQDGRIRNPHVEIYQIDRDRPILPPGFSKGKLKEISKAPPPGWGYIDIRHIDEDIYIGGMELDELLKVQCKSPLPDVVGHFVPWHPNVGVGILHIQEVWIPRKHMRSIRFLSERYLLDANRNPMRITFTGAAFKDHSGQLCWLSVYSNRSHFLGEMIPVQPAVRYKYWETLAA